jgi:hypothetical protein
MDVHCKGITCGHGNGESRVFFRDCDIFAFWGIYIIEHVTPRKEKQSNAQITTCPSFLKLQLLRPMCKRSQNRYNEFTPAY